IKNKYNISDNEICYIGDDVLDIPVLSCVGFSVAVANAREEVKAICDYCTVARGGRGAVREVIDLILKRQGKFDKLLSTLTEKESG
ncbi:MAG: HAD hydrolase family protein, partial [Anaerolineales bacterium]